ncbi:MAG: PIN domain-containing protein [Desulfobacterales bacterium]|nr:MAG: PIN domain-containing protein [Desulfobacterales bacterium]
MKKYIIDTNALISFVTDRNPGQQDKIAAVFDRAAQLKVKVLCPQNVLTEFVYVMNSVYDVANAEIRDMVKDFISMPGVEIVHEINLQTLLSYWPEKVPDYGDAIIAVLCKDTSGSSVATFDQKFRAKLKKLDLAIISFKKSEIASIEK